ncbi:MAG: oligosaccharide flippase family protein [Desulfobacteraceae bacterium]|nr:oligosaccharide flippase family protein [Desulfobacteraceae bacterium]
MPEKQPHIKVNRTKQAALGFVTNVGGQFILTVATFILTPIILGFTSKSLYGFWVASLSILAYLSLIDFGLGVSLMRIVAGLYGCSHDDEINKVVSTGFFSFLVAGLVFIAIGLGVAGYIPSWFKIPADEARDVIWAYRVVVIAGAVSLPLLVFNSVISGVQRMVVNNTIRIVLAPAGFVVSIILLYCGFGLLALALSHLFTVLSTGVVTYLFCKLCYLPDLKISPFLVNRCDLKRLWSFSGYYQIGRIAYIITISTDAILIGAILGAAAVSPYALTSKLAVLISVTIASKLPITLFPALSQMFARKEMDKLRRAYIGLAYYSTRIAVMGSILLVVANRHFVSLWVGPELFGGNILNAVFVSWVLLDTIFYGTGIVVVASGDLRNWAIASAAEAILNIAFSLLLIKPLGLVGVALGTTFSRLLTTDIYVPILTCHKLKLSLSRFVWRGVFCPAIRSLPGGCLIVLFAILVPSAIGWIWLIGVGLVAVVANVFSFEVLEFMKLSDRPFDQRLRELFLLQSV